MPHTAASLEERLEVLRLLQIRHPQAGWKLLLDLLPHGGESIAYHHTPEWRFWAEHWQRRITGQEYARTVRAIIDLALSAVAEAPEKWIDLLPRVFGFSRDVMMRLASSIDELRIESIPVEMRHQIWAALSELLERHQYLSDEKWSLPQEFIQKLMAAREKLQPSDPIELALPIFQRAYRMIGRKSLSFEERQKLSQQLRVEALRRVLDGGGFDHVLALARRVENPWQVGWGLVEVSNSEFESKVLPLLLACGDSPLEQFAKGFTECRIYSQNGRDWAESLPLKDWQPRQGAILTSLMPFDQRTWTFMNKFDSTVENDYWRITKYLPQSIQDTNIEYAARKLLSVNRPRSSINLLAFAVNSKCAVSPVAQLEILESAFGSQPEQNERPIDAHDIHAVLGQIQASPDIDQTRVAKIEWLLLPTLDHHFGRPQTLHRLLSADPGFFIEVLSLVYRGHHESDQKHSIENEEVREFKRHHAERAWHLLREWQRIPGTNEDGTIDPLELRLWVDRAQELARKCDRLEVCDLTLGEVLAHAPEDSDGSWPCVAVRDLLEGTDSTGMIRGLSVGVFNKRGTTCRSPHEGGRQERELAAKYEGYANTCQNRWPKTAAALRRIAEDYLWEARREDAEAAAER
jgi:hypothetical protein